MSEFFSQKNPPTSQEERKAQESEWRKQQEAGVSQVAEQLRAPAHFLAKRLLAGGENGENKVAMDVIIMNPNRGRIVETAHLFKAKKSGQNGAFRDKPARVKVPKPAGRLQVLKNGLRDQNKLDANFHHEENPEPIAQGWLVSEVKSRAGESTVILLESGDLYIGEKLNKTKKDGNHFLIEPLLDDEFKPVGQVDLSRYPFNPILASTDGFSETIGKIPQAVKDGQVEFGTEYSKVAINLEQIEYNLREFGRRHLRSGEA